MRTEREMHCWRDDNRVEYWEHSHAAGWREIDSREGDNWRGDTYRLIEWPPGQETINPRGGPPRVSW